MAKFSVCQFCEMGRAARFRRGELYDGVGVLLSAFSVASPFDHFERSGIFHLNPLAVSEKMTYSERFW
jgi:hypothetical protein